RAPQYSALACAPGRCCGLVLRLLRFLPGFCCFSFSGLWMSDIIQRLASVIAQAMLGMALEKFFEGIFGLVVLLQVFLIDLADGEHGGAVVHAARILLHQELILRDGILRG